MKAKGGHWCKLAKSALVHLATWCCRTRSLTWTNADKVPWHHIVSAGLNESSHLSHDTPGNPFANLGRKHLPCGKYVYLMMFMEFLGRKCPFGWIPLIATYWREFLIRQRHISVRFCVVKPHAVPSIFCLKAQTDYYKGHPGHFADKLPDYLGWIQLSAVSTYGDMEAFPWKTHWNDILFDKCRKILKLYTNEQNQSRNFYQYPPGFIGFIRKKCYEISHCKLQPPLPGVNELKGSQKKNTHQSCGQYFQYLYANLPPRVHFIHDFLP